MVTHIVACSWIIFANLDPDQANSWISGYKEVNRSELYLTSFYFTVTTITTVGYGDMSASTFMEQIICIFIMLAGVIAFSLSSGALTNYISEQNRKSRFSHDGRVVRVDDVHAVRAAAEVELVVRVTDGGRGWRWKQRGQA